MILALRTDKPEAEIYLLNANWDMKGQIVWQAHRELSSTLIEQIENLLKSNNLKLSELAGIIVFQGPGSFTGLRIGITVVNTLAYSLNIPNVAAQGEEWFRSGLEKLKNQSSIQIIQPEYGQPPHITKPRK